MTRFTLIAFLGLLPGLAAAQPVTLKVADILPAGHYIARESIGFWMTEMTRQAGDRIKFEYYPAEQLGKARDMLTLLKSGAVDMAYIAPGYIPEKFPLSGSAELPRMASTSCEGTKPYWTLTHGGFLDRREFAPAGIVPLISFMSAPSQLEGRGAPHDPVTDLRGLKVRGTGSAMDVTIRTLGGVPIQVPGPDIRQALERGTIDGVIGLSPSAVTYEHVRFLNYTTTNANLSAPGLTYSISAARWKTLPPDLRSIMLDVAEQASRHFCAAADRLEHEALSEMQKHGIAQITLSPEELARLDTQVALVRSNWVESMQKRGLPGQDALDAFEKAK